MSSTKEKRADITNAIAPRRKALSVTFFRNKSAATLEARNMSMEELYELILGTNRETKGELPLLKCANFGDERTDKGSLRHDANVIWIRGIEGDYDGEVVSFEQATKAIKAARLSALLYTAPSNSKEKPRWRVLCPTSCDLPPEERTKLVARLNGILGGILAPESFTLSQSYYYGSVNNSAEHRAAIVEGDYIDLRDDLDTRAIGKSKKNVERVRGFEAHLALLGDGPGLEGFNGPLCSATASYAATHGVDLDRDKLKALLREAIELAPKAPGRPATEIKGYLGDAYLDDLIASAIEKFGMSDDVARLNAVHAVLPIGGKTRVVTFGELEEFPGRKAIVMTQTLGDFRALQNKYRYEYTDGKGEIKSIPLGTYWLSSRNRRQYDGGRAFMPRHSEKVVGNRLNLWHGPGVKPVKPDGKSGAAGCDKFLGFMCEVICSDNEEHFDYLRTLPRGGTPVSRDARTH